MFKDYEYKLQGEGVEEGGTQKVVFDPTGGGDREKGMNFKATVGKTGKVGHDARRLTAAPRNGTWHRIPTIDISAPLRM